MSPRGRPKRMNENKVNQEESFNNVSVEEPPVKQRVYNPGGFSEETVPAAVKKDIIAEIRSKEIPNDIEIKSQQKIIDDGEYTLEVIMDFDGQVDPFYLSKKDPNFQYRFLLNAPDNVYRKSGNLLHQKGGWQICPKSHCLRIGIPEKLLSPKGEYLVNEHILAFMPKWLHEKKEAYKRKQAQAPMDMIKRQSKEGINDPNIKGIHASMRGIQTAKQLGMKTGFVNEEE